jgi:signal transduction histidine kinase
VLSRNVDHLGLMVKDLLDASRIQSQELRLVRQRVDLDRVLREAVDSFASGGATGIDVRYEGAPGLEVDADPARLTQVVFNLVGNALRFTPRGGRITVRARRDRGEAVFEVEDTGAGIPPQDLKRLFQPFSQVHDTMQETKSGTGLGLFISRGIVESHGGRISAHSEGRGKGATFRVCLPLADAATRVQVR